MVVSYCGFYLHFPDEQFTEHLFIGLLAICISSFVKCQLKSFAYFYWAICPIIDSLYILDTNTGFLLNANNRT